MTMTRQEYADRLTALAGLRKLLNAEEFRLKAEAAPLFKVGAREVTELGGEDTGTVQMIKGTSTWTVVDGEAWLAWVQAHRPGEIVPAVRSSYEKATLAQLARDEGLVDEDTGELIVPPGVIPKRGEPTLRVSPSKDAPDVVLRVLGETAGLLGLRQVEA